MGKPCKNCKSGKIGKEGQCTCYGEEPKKARQEEEETDPSTGDSSNEDEPPKKVSKVDTAPATADPVNSLDDFTAQISTALGTSATSHGTAIIDQDQLADRVFSVFQGANRTAPHITPAQMNNILRQQDGRPVSAPEAPTDGARPDVDGQSGELNVIVLNFGGTVHDVSNIFNDLMEMLAEEEGNAPLTEDEIAAIPLVPINQQMVDQGEQCSVCLEKFKNGEEAKKLECNHLFHQTCIASWLRLHGICPLCRNQEQGEEVDSASSSEEEQEHQCPSCQTRFSDKKKKG